MHNPCEHLFVIVPANNEAALIADCLRSIKKSRNHLDRSLRNRTHIIVVCDACTDSTAHIARRMLSGTQDLVVERSFRNVGRARAEGASKAQQLLRSTLQSHEHSRVAERAWYAFTDADTRVPIDWLVRQVAHCDAGHDMVLGVIDVDRAGLDPETLRHFLAHYQQKLRAEAHDHVHGANLGIRASRYWSVGGFQPLAAHEDQALVAQVAAAGVNIVRDKTLSVLTSSRLMGRVTAGVSCDLRKLMLVRQQAVIGYQSTSICLPAC